MSCARCREWILEAALSPDSDEYESALRPELRAHLADCAGCRELLARERALAGRIGAVLRARVAAEPSAAFVAGIRERIAAEPAATPLFGRWQPALAGAMVVMIAVAVWFTAPERVTIPPPPPTESATAVSVPEIAREGNRRRVRERPLQTAPELWAEVIIEPREREGMRWLHAALQTRASRIAAVLAGPGATVEDPLRPLGFPDLQVAPVEIAPMQSGSEAAGGKSQSLEE